MAKPRVGLRALPWVQGLGSVPYPGFKGWVPCPTLGSRVGFRALPWVQGLGSVPYPGFKGHMRQLKES
jgi:hypothetical protein